ncbi:MAG: AraC family transcriptional regulator [Comamonas sp.]
MASLVRAACLTNYAEVATASGLNPARMLFDVGLSPSVLDDPDLMIPVDKVGRLLQNSALVSGSESFGLRMARTRLLSNMGPVGLLMRDQETLRDSLQLLVRHLAMLNGAMTLAVEEQGDTVLIRELLLAGGAHEPTRQRVELALGVMVRAIRQLIGRDWQPRLVCFEHAPPRDMAMHTQMFGPRVEFNHEFNCIICAKSDLDARNEFADPAMVRYAQKLLEQAAPVSGEAVLDDVRRTIVLLLPTGRCSIEKVSEHLGVVPRTIQRRLTDKDQSFSGLMNDIRKELAARYVFQTNRSLTEIAELLGFTAPSSFSRWYLTQFGCSAKESRAKGSDRSSGD